MKKRVQKTKRTARQVVLAEPLELGGINANGADICFTAGPEELAQVLEVIGIINLSRLEGEVRIKPWHKTGFMLVGELRASVVQECVVSLEPVPEEVVEPFERTFIPEAEAMQEEPDEHVEVDFILEAEDPPELLIGHTVNLLEIIAEHLALGLNPWPRKDGAEIDPKWQPGEDGEDTPNPFDVLKHLKH